MWHGKTYEDALTTCAAMGTAECPSKLLKVENIPALVGADPEMRVHGSLFRVDAIRREGRWVDSMEV